MIWVHDDFLSDKDFEELSRMIHTDFVHVNNKDFKPLMADTEMSYRASNMDIYMPIYIRLNILHNMGLTGEKYHILNMQYKEFWGIDHYALHAEDKKIYGDWAYVLYLSDEDTGSLVIPSESDALIDRSEGFEEMCNQFTIEFLPKTAEILPKKNRCVVMKTGLAHMVNTCIGVRPSIAGWPEFNK